MDILSFRNYKYTSNRQNMLSEILKLLWYKENEIVVFLIVASLGNAPASSIAQKANIKRTTCYQLLEMLSEKGIIKKHIKSKIRFYSAITLEELEKKLKSSIWDLSSGLQIIERNREEIERSYSKNYWNTRVSFYEWFDDIKNAYEEILDSDDKEILTFAKKDFNIKTHPLKSFWDKYYYKRLELWKESFNIVGDDNSEAQQFEYNIKKLRHNLKLPNSIISTYWDLKISWDKIIIVSQNEGRIFGLLIENTEIAKMFKDIFRVVWKSFAKDTI